MKEFGLFIVVCCGLALLVEIVYVLLKTFTDRYFDNKYHLKDEDTPILEYESDKCTYNRKGNDFDDPFDLKVKVDKIRFGDEP